MMNLSFTLTAESACNIILLRHSPTFDVLISGVKNKCEIQDFVFGFRLKIKKNGCLGTEIQASTKDGYFRRFLIFVFQYK